MIFYRTNHNTKNNTTKPIQKLQNNYNGKKHWQQQHEAILETSTDKQQEHQQI